MRATQAAVLISLLLILGLAGPFSCGSDDADKTPSPAPPVPAGTAQPPSGDDDDDAVSSFSVIYEWALIPGANPPCNPVTGAETSAKYNRVPVFRFRQDTGFLPPNPVRGVLILAPGFAAGVSDLFVVAHDLVEMSEGNLEVWIVDRRSNLLEDQTGLDAAEAARDPWIAHDYYFEGVPVNGQTFGGWIDSRSPATDMMSEWGLDVQLRDLRKVIELVPAVHRQTNVFIGGHSRGARLAQMFAAYEFGDGTLGADLIAGILLFDYMADTDPMNEAAYLRRLERIRNGSKPRHDFSKIGINAASVAVQTQILAMAASNGFGQGDPQVGPDGFFPTWWTFEIGRRLITRGRDIRMTNEATVGLIFDDETSPFPSGFYGKFGAVTGGQIGHDLLGPFPSDPDALYTWVPFDQTEPPERADLQRLLPLIYAGPSDCVDMYYPTRLTLDDDAAGKLETEGTWVHDYLRFFTSRMDVPVLALEGIVGHGTGYYETYRDRLAPVRGQSLPRTAVGFDVHSQPDWGHIEVLAIEPDRNPFYPRFLQWMDEWSVGEVQVPAFNP